VLFVRFFLGTTAGHCFAEVGMPHLDIKVDKAGSVTDRTV